MVSVALVHDQRFYYQLYYQRFATLLARYHGPIDHFCPWGIGVWNRLPVAAKPVAGQRRACAIQMMCRMEKQRHSEGGNVAHGKDGHGPSGDSMRINDPGERAQ